MQFVNEQDAATRERFIERLEFRATDPTFVAYREAYLELIDLPRTAAVLDLGCGTGVVARAIAARDGFAGTVTGVDQSPDFIAAARRLAAEDGVGERVEFVVGDAHALDLPAASFDAVVAHTLVSHVRDPLAVLAQAARVVRPGGTVAIFDGDYASLTFGCSDPRLGEAMEGAVQSMIMSSPRVMRELPRLLPKAGLRLVATQAHVYAEAGSSSFMLNLAETYAPLAASTGLLPAADVEAWLADQRRSADGRHVLRGLQLLRLRGARGRMIADRRDRDAAPGGVGAPTPRCASSDRLRAVVQRRRDPDAPCGEGSSTRAARCGDNRAVVRRISSPVFVGRAEELEALDAALAAARGRRGVAPSWSSGEAGIGKTRLLDGVRGARERRWRARADRQLHRARRRRAAARPARRDPAPARARARARRVRGRARARTRGPGPGGTGQPGQQARAGAGDARPPRRARAGRDRDRGPALGRSLHARPARVPDPQPAPRADRARGDLPQRRAASAPPAARVPHRPRRRCRADRAGALRRGRAACGS